MQVTTLKVYNLPDWSSLNIFDDKVYSMRVKWNSCDGGWYLSLYTDDNADIIIEGAKIVLNIDLLQYSYSIYKPIGYLVALSTTANKITFDNFGSDVKLQYLINDGV